MLIKWDSLSTTAKDISLIVTKFPGLASIKIIKMFRRSLSVSRYPKGIQEFESLQVLPRKGTRVTGIHKWGWTELTRTEFNTRASIFPIKVYIWSQKCWHGTVSKSFSIFLQTYLNQDIYWCQFLTQVVSWLGGITQDAAHSSSKELILRLEVGLVWCHQPR